MDYTQFFKPAENHYGVRGHEKKFDERQIQIGRVRFAGGLGGSTLPMIFLTPRVSVDLSSWGVDSNPSVSVIC